MSCTVDLAARRARRLRDFDLDFDFFVPDRARGDLGSEDRDTVGRDEVRDVEEPTELAAADGGAAHASARAHPRTMEMPAERATPNRSRARRATPSFGAPT